MKTASLITCLLFGVFAGCDSGNRLYPITGTVKMMNGSVPQGEVAKIRFEPIAQASDTTIRNPASGTIAPDGTFSLTTLKQNDGAYAGEYKVTLTVHKTYIGRESLIAPKYTQAVTTPLTATVGPDSPKHFDFVLDPK